MKREIFLLAAILSMAGCATYDDSDVGRGGVRAEPEQMSGIGTSTQPDVGSDFSRGESWRVSPPPPAPNQGVGGGRGIYDIQDNISSQE